MEGSKEQLYKEIIPQAESLFADEPNFIANCSNLCALLHNAFDFWWTGFYFVDAEELILGPFQGPVACTRIAKGKGVCGTAWANEEIIVVPDVHQFEGHIACSAESNSEIVVPVFKEGKIAGVFDVDSKDFNSFDQIDAHYLQKLLSLISR